MEQPWFPMQIKSWQSTILLVVVHWNTNFSPSCCVFCPREEIRDTAHKSCHTWQFSKEKTLYAKALEASGSVCSSVASQPEPSLQLGKAAGDCWSFLNVHFGPTTDDLMTYHYSFSPLEKHNSKVNRLKPMLCSSSFFVPFPLFSGCAWPCPQFLLSLCSIDFWLFWELSPLQSPSQVTEGIFSLPFTW